MPINPTTKVRIACLGGAAAMGLTLLSATATAQSLEQLQRQVEAQNRRIEQLESEAGGTDPSATGGAVRSGEENVRLTLSGQVNRGVMVAYNGALRDIFHVDNSNSSSRLRFIGEADLNSDVTIGSHFEVEFPSNPSNLVTFDQPGASGLGGFQERDFDLYFDSDRFGRVSVGQGASASNGTSEVDLSGTAIISNSDMSDVGSNLQFEDTPDRFFVLVGNNYNNFDGLGRDDRIRYDTPNVAGLSASVSALEARNWDGALNFSGEIAGVRIAAALGYAEAESQGNEWQQTNGSASILLPLGQSLTAAFGERDEEIQDFESEFYYVKVGQHLDLFNFGRTAFSIDYGYAESIETRGDQLTSRGAAIVQSVDSVATDFYLGVREHAIDFFEFDDPPEIVVLLIGARVKF